jgi:YidC/Oxa1 family membrane protein insertase
METRRMILAIALSLTVWYLWLYFVKKPALPVNPAVDIVKEEPAQRSSVDKKDDSIKFEKTGRFTIQPSKVVKEEEIEILTDRYKVKFSNRGGSIKSFKFIDRNVELVVKNENKYSARGDFDFSISLSEDEFLGGSELSDVLWEYRKDADNAIRFIAALFINGNKFQLEKIYTFTKQDYFFKVDYRLVNTGKTRVELPNGYVIISPGDFLGPEMDFNNQYNQLSYIYNLDGDYKTAAKGGGFFSGKGTLTREKGNIKWAGLMSRYFLLIMLGEKFSASGVIYDTREDASYRAGLIIPADKIEAGGKFEKSFKVYAGEKDKANLALVDNNLVDAADVSKWIEPIRDFLLWCLLKINLLVGNLGWSLVIFSILTKLVLLPLTQKSTESMKKMQELAPKMNELKEKFKDRPDQLNKEVMKMYKTNKVNPLGGCLPLILQMPFFFALWSALINSIDLWHAPFILWINDLSLPDTVFSMQGYNLNILPIIMTGTSYIQQKLTTPTGGTSQQQKMMMFMPLVFIFIFWNMPSGLVLYWTLQNVLQILNQIYVNKKTEGVKE